MLKYSRIKSFLYNNTLLYSFRYKFDLIVIGGGSGGIACAREAAKLGKKVACFDYVTKTPFGNTWGLGGTCVNVGCIPKKLFHQGGLVGDILKKSNVYGWNVDDKSFNNIHDWSILKSNVQNYIKSLNWGYRNELGKYNVEYHNAFVKFKDKSTITAHYNSGEEKLFKSSNFVIAVGGRPTYLNIPGSHLAITSDDLFTLPRSPGKTLIIGASYIALESAGFLSQFGCDVHVMVRSKILRNYDQEMANMIEKDLSKKGINFIMKSQPISFEKQQNSNNILVKYKNNQNNNILKEEFNTVMLAIGRTPSTKHLNLECIGVKTYDNGKIETNHEQTNIDNIYAIGDVQYNKPELTPVAIQAGKLLARRLYSTSKIYMNYSLIPTCIFTPLEYGCCGYSEEDAYSTFGKDNIEVYITHYTPTSWGIEEKEANICYLKIICKKDENEKVIGFHILGENAGEITQGISIAMKAGVTKDILDQTCGIHPTSAEEMTGMEVTRKSGLSPIKSTC